MINLFLMKHILKYLASGHQLETCVLLEFRSCMDGQRWTDRFPLFYTALSPLVPSGATALFL